MAYADLRATQWSQLGFTIAYSVSDIARYMNRRYQNTLVTQPGQVIKIPKFNPGSLTVRSSWTSTSSDTSYGDVVSVTVDQEKSIAYEHPDLDPLQIPADVAGAVVDGMGRRIGREMDLHAISTISGSASSVAITSYDTLVDARATIAGNGYSTGAGDVWLFASSTQYKNLLKDDDINRATPIVSDQVSSGEVRRIAGVNVVEQTVDPISGVMFHTDAAGFIVQNGITFTAESMFGGTAKFATRFGAKALYKGFLLDANGCLRIANT